MDNKQTTEGFDITCMYGFQGCMNGQLNILRLDSAIGEAKFLASMNEGARILTLYYECLLTMQANSII